MDAKSIAKAITRAILGSLVLGVFSLSLLFANEINGSTVFMALSKSLLTLFFGWIFILILSDTLVKSIAASAREAQASRKDGGFIYHFLKPDHDEIVDESMSEASKGGKV